MSGVREPIRVVAVVMVAIASVCVHAQWLNYPTAGIPRAADGKPNLNAPMPRGGDGKPDLSGVWRWNPGRYGNDVTLDLAPGEIQPWAEALAKERQETLAKDDPANMQCRPQGPRANLVPFNLAKVVQMPGLVVVMSEDMSFRQIFTDGRALPADPNPSWMGYSVGRWEGDTLVVESLGFNDRTWLDFIGHPHTEALRVTERWRRRDFGHIEIEKTFDDRGAYTRSWTIAVTAEFVPDTDLLEYVCENERDRAHLVGTASDGIDMTRVVTLAGDILSRYAGTYEYRLPESPDRLRALQLTLKDGHLFVDGNRALVPLSTTRFVLTRGAVRMDFVLDERGTPNSVVVHRVQGCGGSSGVAASVACGETAAEVTAVRRR